MSSSALPILAMLRHIGTASTPLSVTEISRDLKLSTTTAHRGLMTLLNAGYIERYQSSSRYVVGGASKRLLQAFLARFAIRDFATPYLNHLAIASGETTALIVPLGWYGVRIAAARGTNRLVHSRPLGEVRWLDGGAGPKVLLANLTDGEIAKFLSHVRFDRNPSRRTMLQEELRAIRTQRFALGTAHREGRAEIAVAVRDTGGKPLAAIVIEGHAVAPKDAGQNAAARLLLEAAGRMERAAGALANHYAHLPRDLVRLKAVEE